METILLIILVLVVLAWAASLRYYIGVRRSFIVGVCRFLWILPIIIALYPKKEQVKLPKTVRTYPIRVFVDDSSSMRVGLKNGRVPLARVKEHLVHLQNECKNIGCEIRSTFLSDKNKMTHRGFSPIRKAIDPWLSKEHDIPWIIMTDGGDYQPSAPWPDKIRDLGASSKTSKHKGLVVGVDRQDQHNIWIDRVEVHPFSFVSKPFSIDVLIKRESLNKLEEEHVQLQILLDQQLLTTKNGLFEEGQSEAWVNVMVSSLPRGQHLLKIKALPTSKEVVAWDNESYAQVEVVSNTLGVLHLLGNPSWDGRFLRRYLKSEPKYDLISFFILRDPWDSQNVKERDLSLIPFPVSRLFNEELVNFRVVILQNFNLLQFLLPQYQRNLVNFVKEGGGLFFIGGPRALLSSDLRNSPLRELIPFSLKNNMHKNKQQDSWGDLRLTDKKKGPWYDDAYQYKIELAQPSLQKRELATVFEYWAGFSRTWKKFEVAQGLHHMENVKFNDSHTPLLNAVGKNNEKIPLAVASYPGKGRAAWLFSDSFWRLALTPGKGISRSVYHKFMESTFTWLMRDDLKKPLTISNFQISVFGNNKIKWFAQLQGPASRYLRLDTNWSFRLCDQVIAGDSISMEKLGPHSFRLSGSQDLDYMSLSHCQFSVQGQHPAFGSVQALQTVHIPKVLNDIGVGHQTEQKVKKLAELTGAKLLFMDYQSNLKSSLSDWLVANTNQTGITPPTRYKVLLNHYWHLEQTWVWLLLLFLPLEVFFRRKHVVRFLFGGKIDSLT